MAGLRAEMMIMKVMDIFQGEIVAKSSCKQLINEYVKWFTLYH